MEELNPPICSFLYSEYFVLMTVIGLDVKNREDEEKKKAVYPQALMLLSVYKGHEGLLCSTCTPRCLSRYKCVQVANTHSKAKRKRAPSFPVAQTQSHKSVTGQFLTHLRQHRLNLSLPLKHKRPPVSAGGKREG